MTTQATPVRYFMDLECQSQVINVNIFTFQDLKEKEEENKQKAKPTLEWKYESAPSSHSRKRIDSRMEIRVDS